jgi:hypothetical protein
LALGAVSKKIVESSGVIFQRTGSGLYGLPLLGHGGTPPTGTVIRASPSACCNKLPLKGVEGWKGGNYFYNKNRLGDIGDPYGMKKLGPENVGSFFTRGILIDVAALKNTD